MACDVLILVEEATDAVASVNLVDPGQRVVGERSQGSSLASAAMRPVIVVVAMEFAEHGRSVPSVDDQKTVEEFAADGADEAFGDRVRPCGGVLMIWMSMA